jgi:hypothetical protein
MYKDSTGYVVKDQEVPSTTFFPPRPSLDGEFMGFDARETRWST